MQKITSRAIPAQRISDPPLRYLCVIAGFQHDQVLGASAKAPNRSRRRGLRFATELLYNRVYTQYCIAVADGDPSPGSAVLAARWFSGDCDSRNPLQIVCQANLHPAGQPMPHDFGDRPADLEY